MRREKTKSPSMDKDKNVQKAKSNYKSRYKGNLSPEKDIEQKIAPSYKSRYK